MARSMSDMKPHLLPEWAPHAALWVGWPRLVEEWGGNLDGPRADIAGFIRAASDFVPIRVAVGSDEAEETARAAVGDCADICRIPTGDIWLRDTGPIITGSGDARKAQTFRFNGWGGKYLMPGDTETAVAIADFENIITESHDLVLEGGGIDADGTGRLLTTGQCLLNANRNPDLDQSEIELAISHALGVHEYIWLGDGLLNDHTDGHVDNVARFISPGHAICQHPSGDDDPNAETLQEIETTLRRAGLEVTTIPSPGLVKDEDGNPVPASHMNFTITNGVVLVPVYEDRYSLVALAELSALFEGRQVIGLPARHILNGGGSFHCMTREIPA